MNLEKPIISQDNNIGKEKTKEKEKKSIEVTINDVPYSLEIESYDFEYPERIQKETGILGYERTKISTGSLFNIVKNEAISILDELGVKTEEEFLKIYECYLGSRYDNKHPFTGYNIDRDKSVAGIDYGEYKKIEKIEEIMININEKIVSSLSGGEYPNLCYTHRIAAYTKKSALMNQQFKEDNFFLQKIYDQKRIEENNTNYGHGNHGSSCSLYKDNGDVLEKYCDLREINNQNEINENTAFAAMPKSGLNFWMGDFWKNEFTDNTRSAAFGIPYRFDAFQEEYIKKSLETFCKIEKNELENLSKKDEISTPKYDSKIYDNFENYRGINGTIVMYALNEYIKNHPDYIVKYKKFDQEFDLLTLISDAYSDSHERTRARTTEKGKAFLIEFGDIINKFLIDNNITLEDNSYNIRYLMDIPFCREVNLPVFINHKELPQVSWGYAKYAHYMNKQGLNFFKLRHAEHLPIKEN